MLRALVGGRADAGRARDRHVGGSEPARADRAGRGGVVHGRGRRRVGKRGQELRAGDDRGDQAGRKALNSGGGLSGVTTGLDSINAEGRRAASQRSHHPRRAPGHGQDLAGHQHRVQRRAALDARPRRRHPRRPVGRGQGRVLLPRNVGRPAGDAYPGRTVADFVRSAAHGQDQPRRIRPAGGGGGRTGAIAALHRRYRGPEHRRAPHPRAAAAAAAQQRDRAGGGRLPPAAAGVGARVERQPRAGNLRDQPRAEDAGQGLERPRASRCRS